MGGSVRSDPPLDDPGAELVVGDPRVLNGIRLVTGQEREEVIE
jgi:hypothetical protein